MMSSASFTDLCRLCLVTERVSVPIFDSEVNPSSVFHKISVCLPIKVSPEDTLPKKICDGCFYKVENQYQFWNITTNSERQLLEWFSNSTSSHDNDTKSTLAIPAEQVSLKEESLELDPSSELSKSLSHVEAVLAEEVAREAGAVGENDDDEEEDDDSDEDGSNSEESEDDNDPDEPAKDEGESDEAYDEELEPTTFVNVSLACDEAGPSGTQQQAAVPSTSTSTPSASGSSLQFHLRDSFIVAAPLEGNITLHTEDKCEALPTVYINCDASKPKSKRTTRGGKKNRNTVSKTKAKIDQKKRKGSQVTQERSDSHEKQPLLKTIMPTQLVCTFSGCQRTYTSPYLYDSHVKTHIPKQHPCEVCQKVFSKSSVLKRHMLTHSTERPYSCEVCNKSFKTIFTYDYHRKVAHTDAHKKFVCESCGYATVSDHNLKIHKKRHSGETDFVCEVCGKGAYTKAELESHKAIHTNEKHTCTICQKNYASKRYLFLHQEIHNPKRVKPFQCEQCGRRFQYLNKIKAHMLAHSGMEKRYVCEVCGTSVNSRTYLKIHVRTHTGEKPYSCEVCGKAFNALNYLKVHMRSHTGEKPYACEQCNKRFTQRSTLVVHMRYHTGVRPYCCHICSKSFATRTLLNAHEKIHEPC